MILYVVRHAEAVKISPTLPDKWRYLTSKGRSVVKKIRTSIIKYGPKPEIIITSPLVRAVQTAEILAEKIQKKNNVIANGILRPGNEVSQIIKYIRKHKTRDCIMLVGHEPMLGILVVDLLNLSDYDITFKKGACIALKIKFDRVNTVDFLWYLTPGNKYITSIKKVFYNHR